MKVLTKAGALMLAMLICMSGVMAAPLLDPNEIGFGGKTRSDNYDELVNAMYANGKVVTSVNGKMWVPWYKTSSSCAVSDLQGGSNCNSGSSIDDSHNCMVTDEYSQVGLLVSMGKDQSRMTEFYNTVLATKSSNGNIPAWRIYRSGDTIEPCRQGINGNCDTASDATARIIIALYAGAKNELFTDSAMKQKYLELANTLSNDMLNYEVEKTCRPTDFGTVCNWLAGGSNVKKAGIGAYDFAYTGYYPDAIIAMLQAYANTKDEKFLVAAKDFAKNYMQAANFNGNTFTAPPGKSFRWEVGADGKPEAVCTNTCNPVMWDGYDASRATAICQANYYGKEMGVDLGLGKYCELMAQKETNPSSAAIQFYPNGQEVNKQSGYFAQGLQSLFQSGGNPALYKQTLDSALNHYNTGTRTFDGASCFGVYTQTFAVRSLGMGIGRDAASFGLGSTTVPAPAPAPTPVPEPTPTPTPTPTGGSGGSGTVTTTPTTVCTTKNVTTTTTSTTTVTDIAKMAASCKANGANCAVKSDSTSGVCRTIVFGTPKGDIKTLACKKDNNYVELYRQAAPSGVSWTMCLANGCVSSGNGFLRFLPKATVTTTTVVPTTTCTSSTAPTPTPTAPTGTTIGTSGVSALPVSLKGVGTKTVDKLESSGCRYVGYSTSAGAIESRICKKEGTFYEMYLQKGAGSSNICVGNSCVGSVSGFARFSATA